MITILSFVGQSQAQYYRAKYGKTFSIPSSNVKAPSLPLEQLTFSSDDKLSPHDISLPYDDMLLSHVDTKPAIDECTGGTIY